MRSYASAALTPIPTHQVLAVRLYSGPSYKPINDWLRQVGRLSGDFRRRVSRDPATSFAATVSHLWAAIRKLAAVASAAEAIEPLWRGVRGTLPRHFWVPDEQGLVRTCAPASP